MGLMGGTALVITAKIKVLDLRRFSASSCAAHTSRRPPHEKSPTD